MIFNQPIITDMAKIDPIVTRTISGSYYNSEITELKSCIFKGCINLTDVELPNCSFIGLQAFAECSNLSTLKLMSSSMVTLAHIQAFISTPFDNNPKTGSIFVPASLITTYQTDSVWSYYSSIFVGVS